MFNNKRLKKLEEWKEDIVACEGCNHLIKKWSAFKVKRYCKGCDWNYNWNTIIDTLYFCGNCKPNYDEIDIDGNKIKNKKVIVK